MGRGAIYSAVLHCAIVLLALFGLPWLFDEDEIIEATPVSIVSADQLEDLKREAKELPKPPEVKPESPKPEEVKIPEPPAPAPEPKPEIVEQAPEPEPVIAEPEPLPEPEPEPLPVEQPQKVAVAKPTPPQKPKPPKKDKKKPEDKPKEEVADSMSALLNKLNKEQSATPPQPDAQETQVEQAAVDVRLTSGEENVIREYIRGCWFTDSGKPGFSEMVATVQIDVNPDGSLVRADISLADRLRMQTDQFFRAFAEDAVRAVRKCDPIPMPTSQSYEAVRRFNFRFHASDY